MLVVAVVAILVVGPKDLPGMLRAIGKTVGNLRRMAGDFQRQFSDALKESEIDELKNEFKGVGSIANPLDDINASANELMESIGLDDDDIDEAIAADVQAKPKNKPASKKPAVAGKKPTSSTTKNVTSNRTVKKATGTKKTVAKQAPKKVAAKKPAIKKPSVVKPATRKPRASKSTVKATIATKSKTT